MTRSDAQIGIGLAGIIAMHIAVVPAVGQDPCGYEVAEIIKGPWCGELLGYSPLTSYALDDSGAVAGYYINCLIGPDEAFTWTSDGGLDTLERPAGFSRARARDVEGTNAVGELHMNNLINAVLWQSGAATLLGIPAGGNYSEAASICNGVIVGVWGNNISGPGSRAFVWQDGVMLDLDLPMGPNTSAYDINKAGMVTGWMGQSPGIDSHAYLWMDGEVVDLGVIPEGFTALGRAINDLDPPQVVGQGQVPLDGFPLGAARAILWDNGQATNLGTLDGYAHTAALDVNDATEIVGRAFSPGVTAFIWRNGLMQDINDLVLDPGGLSFFHSPVSINNLGEISCNASDGKGDDVGVVLVPAALAFADLTCDGLVGLDDFVALLNAWGPCKPGPCMADLDDDGSVGVVDFLLLLAHWG